MLLAMERLAHGMDAELAARMHADLERLRGELSARRATRSLEAGESTLQMLQGIGYLGDE